MVEMHLVPHCCGRGLEWARERGWSCSSVVQYLPGMQKTLRIFGLGHIKLPWWGVCVRTSDTAEATSSLQTFLNSFKVACSPSWVLEGPVLQPSRCPWASLRLLSWTAWEIGLGFTFCPLASACLCCLAYFSVVFTEHTLNQTLFIALAVGRRQSYTFCLEQQKEEHITVLRSVKFRV